eukprot:UN11670
MFLIDMFFVVIFAILLTNPNYASNISLIATNSTSRILTNGGIIVYTTNITCGNYSNSTMGHCCVCMREKPFPTINGSEFRQRFKFYCSHASTEICRTCWIDLFNRTQQLKKCPFNSHGHHIINIPYGDTQRNFNPLIYIEMQRSDQIKTTVGIILAIVGVLSVGSYVIYVWTTFH